MHSEAGLQLMFLGKAASTNYSSRQNVEVKNEAFPRTKKMQITPERVINMHHDKKLDGEDKNVTRILSRQLSSKVLIQMAAFYHCPLTSPFNKK
jgi:hypothetical protein